MPRKLINDTYEILEEIGSGGMSVIYKARHVRLNTIWAIKKVSKHQNGDWNFLAETNILKRLNHPMLVRIVDILEDDDSVYIVEDFIAGNDLKHLLAIQKKFPEETLRKWFRELCEVLIYLHEQKPHPIIFRDMKPANIMLQNDNRLKLIDFGIAREYKKDSAGDTTVAFSYGYAAPEQFNARIQSDARTDIYSLGMTMYHLATGKSPLEPPYEMQPARQLNPDLSAGMEIILKKCTQQNPSDRYQSVRELLDDLDHIDFYDESYKAFLKKKKARKITIAALYLCGALAIGGGYFLRSAEIEQKYNALIARAMEMDYESAVSVFQEAQQLMPDVSAAYTGEIDALYKSGKFANVISRVNDLESRKAISQHSNQDIYTLLGSAYYELSDYNNAVTVFKNVYENGSLDNSDALLDYAAALGKTGDYDSASALVDELLKSADDLHAEYMKGELDYLQGNYRDAAESFRTVLNTSDLPDSLKRRTYISLAETYRDSSKLDSSDAQSIEDPQSKIISLINDAQNTAGMETNSVLWEMKGQAYSTRGRQKDSKEDLIAAAESYRQVLKLGVKKQYLYVNVFACFEGAGDYEHAAEILDEYQENWPQSFEPHAYRALMLAEMQNGSASPDYSEVLKEYNTAVSMSTSSDNTELIAQLDSLMDALKQNGYAD